MALFFLVIYCFTLSLANSETYSSENLRSIFEKEFCLEGNIHTIYSRPKETKNVKNEKVEGILNLTNIGTVQEKEKPVLSRLNELVGYNQIDHYFKLENEEGPPHNKLFTVELTLDKEKYLGQGRSLKKAKHDAAAKALENTEYEAPKTKTKKPEDIEKLTPTVLLNNLASKLGVGVTYYLLDKDKEEILHSNIVLTEKSKSYIKKLNDSIYLDKKLKMKRDIDSTKGPFRIKLKFAEHVFYTTSHSIQSGRHEVASMALEYIVKNRDTLDIACLKEGFENECKQNKDELKSPVSKVYEEAQKRKLDIEFEVIKESGPSHKKSFTTECRLGEIVTVGEGFSKKESKKIAAINMLDKISEMEPLPFKAENFQNTDKKGKKKRKKNKMIKTKLDEIGMVLDQVVAGMRKTFFGDDKAVDSTDDSIDDSTYDSEDNKQKPANKQKPKQMKDHKDGNRKSSQDELLELSNILNFEIAYTDFDEKNQHISLLSLYTNPEYTCFGESKTEYSARDMAADNGLKLLNKMGIYDLFLEQKENPLDRETKVEIRAIMDQIVSKKKEEL